MMDTARILVVDDESEIRKLLKEFLEGRGYAVITASNGQDAIKAVTEQRPHVILLDIMMPGMNGLEALKRIREIDQAVGVIVVTGFAEEMIAKEAMRLAACECIPKPIDLDYLELAILTKLAQKDWLPGAHPSPPEAGRPHSG